MIANSFPALQVVGLDGLQFDASKFGWLGTMAATVETMAIWHTAGINSIEDCAQTGNRRRRVRQGRHHLHLAGGHERSAGYPVQDRHRLYRRQPINLAMERGEVQARNNTWSSWKATKPDWLRDKKISIIVQAGPRASDLDAPSLEDLAKSAEDRQLIELIVSGTQLGRPLATTPGVPEERLKALREAFAATMKDPEFRRGSAQAEFRGRAGARRCLAESRRQGAQHAEKRSRPRPSDFAGVTAEAWARLMRKHRHSG